MPSKSRKKRSKKRSKAKPQPRQLRTSERSTFNTCRWQWAQGYGNRLSPRREMPALRFGTLIHAALEVRYPPGIKRGPKPAETFEKLFLKDLQDAEAEFGRERVRDAEGEWEDMLGLGIDMLEGYIEKYGKDEDWKVIASEMTFQVPVYLPKDMVLDPAVPQWMRDKFNQGEPIFFYVGTMDGVWENRMDGGIRINDYKTTSSDPTKEAMGKYQFDEQATAYWTWGADWLIEKGVLKPRQVRSLDGMLYTFLYKAKRDTRPTNAQGLSLNQDGSVSKKQPTPRFHREVVYRSEQARERARERVVYEVAEMAAVKSGELTTRKNFKTGSMGHCGWCPFRDMCELHEEGGDWELMRDASMRTWDPYDAHEIKDSEQSR
jgi:hypothetical protein